MIGWWFAALAGEIPVEGTKMVIVEDPEGPDRIEDVQLSMDGTTQRVPIPGLSGEIAWIGPLAQQPGDQPEYFDFTLDGKHGVLHRNAVLNVPPLFDAPAEPVVRPDRVDFTTWKVHANGKVGVLERDGRFAFRMLLEPAWDDISMGKTLEAAVKRDGAWGYIDNVKQSTEPMVPPTYDEIRIFPTFLGVRKGDRWGVYYTLAGGRSCSEPVFTAVRAEVSGKYGSCLVVLDDAGTERCVHSDGKVRRHKP